MILRSRLLATPRWMTTVALVLLLSACSYSYQLRDSIVTGESANATELADAAVIIAKSAHMPADLSGMMTPRTGADGILVTQICCTPSPQIWVYVFLDENQSGRWDPDDPHVMDPDSQFRMKADYAVKLSLP